LIILLVSNKVITIILAIQYDLSMILRLSLPFWPGGRGWG
jgi:hypothetical protein